MDFESVVVDICDDLASRNGLGNVFDEISSDELQYMQNKLCVLLKKDYEVESILEYIQSCRGWRQEWESIDEITQEEILDSWQDILDEHEEE